MHETFDLVSCFDKPVAEHQLQFTYQASGNTSSTFWAVMLDKTCGTLHAFYAEFLNVRSLPPPPTFLTNNIAWGEVEFGPKNI